MISDAKRLGTGMKSGTGMQMSRGVKSGTGRRSGTGTGTVRDGLGTDELQSFGQFDHIFSKFSWLFSCL